MSKASRSKVTLTAIERIPSTGEASSNQVEIAAYLPILLLSSSIIYYYPRITVELR